MKIQLKIEGRAVAAATLADSEPARTFAGMLPLAVTLYDLFGREKFGALPGPADPLVAGPGPISQARTQTLDCARGSILCWTTGPDLAIIHGHDRKPVTGGFHVLGMIDDGVEAFDAAGPVTVTIEHLGRSSTPAQG